MKWMELLSKSFVINGEASFKLKAVIVMPQAGHKARELQEEADRLRAKAEPSRTGPGWRTSPSGPWRRSRTARKAAGLTSPGKKCSM